jgi:hypothetical protein
MGIIFSVGILCLNIFDGTSSWYGDTDCYTINTKHCFISLSVCIRWLMFNECWVAGGMRTGRRKQGTLTEPVPVPHCPPQSHMDWHGIECGLPQWDAGSFLRELWYVLESYLFYCQHTMGHKIAILKVLLKAKGYSSILFHSILELVFIFTFHLM